MVNLYPSRDFWESSLEMPVDHWLPRFHNEEIRNNWLSSLSSRQLNVVFFHCFEGQQQLFKEYELWKCDDFSVQQKRKMLMDCSDSLFNYYLLSHFNHSKFESAVVEVAKSALNEALMAQFLCRNHKYDKKSLIFVLFHHDPELIKCVHHFDKVQKRGSSSFTLQNSPRQMKTPFKNFISKEVIHTLLLEYDAEKNDGFETQLQGFFYHQDRIYVFMRRASDKDLLFNANRIIHGYRPDLIAMDFALHGNQVNLYAKDPSESLKIANIIVSHYFERECSFTNTQDQNCTLLVTTFLKSSIEGANHNICLFEIRFRFKKDTYFVVATNPVNSIARELRILKLTIDNSIVESIRIMFQKKKVSLFFKRNQNYTVIFYSEHVLNRKEREDFKSLMKETYGLTILPKASCCRYSGIS